MTATPVTPVDYDDIPETNQLRHRDINVLCLMVMKCNKSENGFFLWPVFTFLNVGHVFFSLVRLKKRRGSGSGGNENKARRK